MVEVATVADNGQVTLPPSFAADLSSAQVKQLIIYSDGDSIVLKPIKKPDPTEYKTFMKEAQSYSSAHGMEEADIQDAIKAVRADA
jgi:bifunctional DNA-binding transcriptional regulator/antitoxin component of YhaV-PrlF toxin-antitoxin module